MTHALEAMTKLETIWEGETHINPDGSVTHIQHPDYDAWHNANKLIAHMGGKRQSGNSTTIYWLMPDGSRLRTNPQGTEVREVSVHTKERPPC